MNKVQPIEQELWRLQREMDALWDSPKEDHNRELFLNRSYQFLREEQLNGELYYIPF